MARWPKIPVEWEPFDVTPKRPCMWCAKEVDTLYAGPYLKGSTEREPAWLVCAACCDYHPVVKRRRIVFARKQSQPNRT